MADDIPPPQATIRNAVIHLNNEQPLLADLFDMPAAPDQGLLCTNLRTLNGKRPVFADEIESIFYFPYQHIRFVEIHPSRDQKQIEAPAPAAKPEEAEEDLEIDEDFLRRIREV
jgi:hypothetical protein